MPFDGKALQQHQQEKLGKDYPQHMQEISSLGVQARQRKGIDASNLAELPRAELNRRLVAQGFAIEWHQEQEKMSLGWELCEPKPKELRVYELPEISLSRSN